jgi:hypothetical protein
MSRAKFGKTHQNLTTIFFYFFYGVMMMLQGLERSKKEILSNPSIPF